MEREGLRGGITRRAVGGITAEHRWREYSRSEWPTPASCRDDRGVPEFISTGESGYNNTTWIQATLGPHPKWTCYPRAHLSPGLPATQGDRCLAPGKVVSPAGSPPVPTPANRLQSPPWGSWQLSLLGLPPGPHPLPCLPHTMWVPQTLPLNLTSYLGTGKTHPEESHSIPVVTVGVGGEG